MLCKYLYSKRILKREYRNALQNVNSSEETNRIKKKYKHCFLTVKFAKKIFGCHTDECSLYLLHDIGRFINLGNQSNHAYNGYNYLSTDKRYNKLDLIPIMMHEEDTNWFDLLGKNSSFLSLDDQNKLLVVEKIKKLKDCDILANMVQTISSFGIDDIDLDDDIYKNCMNNNICLCDKDGYLNECVYIICGIYILNFPESLHYLKNSKIVLKFFDTAIKNEKRKATRTKLVECKEHLIEKGLI